MNYYAEWWDYARKSTGILTKQTYLKQLEQELEKLKTDPSYQHLKSEAESQAQAFYQAEFEKAEAERIKQYNQAKNELLKKTKAIEEREKVTLELHQYCQDDLGKIAGRFKEQKQDYESKLKVATENQANLLKTSLFTETENRQLKAKVEKATQLNQQLNQDLTLLNEKQMEFEIRLTRQMAFTEEWEEAYRFISGELTQANNNLTQAQLEAHQAKEQVEAVKVEKESLQAEISTRIYYIGFIYLLKEKKKRIFHYFHQLFSFSFSPPLGERYNLLAIKVLGLRPRIHIKIKACSN